jgi:hypothetical protein
MAQPTRTVSDISAPPTVKAVPIVDRPRTAEFDWLREHAREHPGQWVALDGSRLLGVAADLRELLRRLTPAERNSNPLFHRIDLDRHFLGYTGFLQRIRFALDPQSNQLYFGAIE